MVRLCSTDFEDVLTGTQYGFLDSGDPCFRFWQRGNGDQHHRHDLLHALQGDESWKDAATGMAHAYDGGPGDSRRKPTHRGAIDAADRSLSRRAFLRQSS